VALLGGALIPIGGFGKVQPHTPADLVHQAKIGLGSRRSIVGRQPVPFGGFRKVSPNTIGFIKDGAKIVLGLGKPLFCGQTIPFQRFRHVLAIGVTESKGELGIGKALAGSKPVPSFGCGAVFWNTLAVLVQGPKIVLGGGVALRGQFLPEQKRLSVTPAGISGGGIFVGPGQSGR